jgi:hypothetical protein
MVGCLIKGSTAVQSFLKDWLLLEEGKETSKKSFYDSLPRMRTMTDMIMDGEITFCKLTGFNEKKKSTLQENHGI